MKNKSHLVDLVCRFIFKTHKRSACIYSKKSTSQQDDTKDIFLDGIVARNRALNGDVVVVQLLPRDQWKVEQRSSLVYSHLDYPWGTDGGFWFSRSFARTQTARAPASPTSRGRTRDKRCRRSKRTKPVLLRRMSLSENWTTLVSLVQVAGRGWRC